jgi:hypothetical protein
MIKRLANDLAWSSVAGYTATLVMERSANFFYERQSESSRQREEQLRQEMPTVTLVRQLGQVVGTKVENNRAEGWGMTLHYAFGASGGPVGVLSQRQGLGPLAAGLAVGTAMWVLVDEGANAVLGLTPPATEWPLVTHTRAVAAHLVYGVALGALLMAGDAALGE